MKTKNIFRSTFLSTAVLSAVLAFSSCSQDSDAVANDTNTYLSKTQENKAEVAEEATFALKLRVQKDGKDITTGSAMKSAKLFVFDSENIYVKTINVDLSTILNARQIEFTCPGTDKVTVIAWGGLDENQVNVSDAKLISDFTLSLKENNGIATTPSDLLYGQATLTANQTKSGECTTLFVERKVSQLEIYVTNVVAKLGSSEGDFYFVVRQTGNSFDYQGNMKGEGTEYIIPATVNKMGNLSCDKTPILSTSDVEIEVYRNDIMVFSTQTAKNADFISTEAGAVNFVRMDLSKKSYDVVTAAWNTKVVVG